MRKNYLLIIQLVLIIILGLFAFNYYKTRNRIVKESETQLAELAIKNEQFTFIVLDTKSINSFHASIDSNLIPTKELNDAIRELRDNPKIETDSNNAEFRILQELLIKKTSISFEYTKGMLTNALIDNNSDDFLYACDLLFYYSTLPKSIQYLYPETTHSGMELDALFLAHLKKHSPSLDTLLNGHALDLSQTNRLQFSRLFRHYSCYEISKSNASKILYDLDYSVFDTPKHRRSKESFSYVLNKVASNQWKMFLIDWRL